MSKLDKLNNLLTKHLPSVWLLLWLVVITLVSIGAVTWAIEWFVRTVEVLMV